MCVLPNDANVDVIDCLLGLEVLTTTRCAPALTLLPALQLKIATIFGAFLDPVADKVMYVFSHTLNIAAAFSPIS